MKLNKYIIYILMLIQYPVINGMDLYEAMDQYIYDNPQIEAAIRKEKEQQRKELTTAGKRKNKYYYEKLDEFNELGSYEPVTMDDYYDNYREPVIKLMQGLKVTQTKKNDPVAMAVAMHDLKFLEDLLLTDKFGDLDLKFKGNRFGSAYKLLRDLEKDKEFREALGYTPYDVRALKATMIEYQPNLFTFEERKASQFGIIQGKTDSMER